MKILYITSIFDRKAISASIRNITLVNGFIELENKIDVLTLNWNKKLVDDFLKEEIKCKNIYKDNLFVLKKINFGKGGNKKLNFKDKVLFKCKEILKDLLFFPDVDKEWIKKYNKDIDFKNYDLIISSSDTKTSHFVGLEIKKKNPDINWIQIWGDPWASDVTLKSIRKKRAYFAEKKLLKKADKVFYVSKPTLEYMKKENPSIADKLDYIPRGYLKKVISENRRKKEEYILSYTGVLSHGRSIYNLLEAVEVYNNENTQKIILNLYGFCDDKIKNEILNLNFVNYYGVIGYKEVLKVYKESDGLLFLSNIKGATQIPGKLFDYFGTDRSILAVMEDTEDNVSKFITENKRAILVENEKNQIKKILKNLISDEKRYPIEQYSGKEIAKLLLNKI